MSNAFWDTMLQQHIPPTAMSRVSSYDWMASLALQPIAFAAVGPMSEVIGTGETLLLAAGLGIAANSAVLLAPSVRNLTRREAVDPPVDPAPSAQPASPASTASSSGSRPAK
jgi:hypothetical protein